MGNSLKKGKKAPGDKDTTVQKAGESPASGGKGGDEKASAEVAKISMDDFEIVKVLGRGAFGKVMLVRKKTDATSKLFALKSLKKADLVKAHQVEHTTTERYVLEEITSPFLVHLSYAFQTKDKLYIVMDYLTGGELFFWLKKQTKFTESRAKLYLAECVLAIEAMHAKNIIHRDLKPENILLDKDGHLKIVDYGLAKGGITSSGANDGGVTTKTFCGTPEYVAPELIENRPHGKAVDWWALGCILYEMLYGLPPFYDSNVNTMYRKILHDTLKFPSNVQTSENAKALIRGMLVRDVSGRMGAGPNGAGDIKNDTFFQTLDFKRVHAKKYTPEFAPPKQKNDADVRNFDAEFTTEAATDSVVDSTMTNTMQKKADFGGFTYQPGK